MDAPLLPSFGWLHAGAGCGLGSRPEAGEVAIFGLGGVSVLATLPWRLGHSLEASERSCSFWTQSSTPWTPSDSANGWRRFSEAMPASESSFLANSISVSW